MTANPDEIQLDDTATAARDLIRIDTTNWGNGKSNGEAEAAEYVAARLAKLGLDPQMFESEKGRVSVVARVEGHYGRGLDTLTSSATRPADSGERPALVVHGHLDVVPADPANWSVDPFEGVIRDGMLWGRGAVDMKNMDAMILTSIEGILGSGKQPARDLVIAFFADEEDGGARGAGHVVDNHPDVFAGATEAISEVGGYSIDLGGTRSYLIQTGEKALVWVKLIARGTAAHGSRLIHDNAITKLATAVAALGTHQWPIHLTDTTTALLGEIARIMGTDPKKVSPDELLLSTGNAAGFLLATLRTTSNPTLLTAGYKHNVIPDTAEALIDIRTIPGQEDTVLEQVRELVGDGIEVHTVVRDIGLETPFRGPLIDTITETLGRHDPGAPILPYLLSGGTDNKALSRLGITGYGFAPLQLPADLDFAGMFHGVDERVPLDALAFGKRVLTDLLLHY
ncbi:MAG TPA: M20/M25/M40 family metallo-hydrolase [Terrimesophilobacter sp.]|nr:M20/M25/M40 family metallo-hydrolase [Terrimesophilobacter sp.]